MLVKPYIPYDVVPSTYTLPMARTASGEPLPIRNLRVPNWIVDSDIPLRTVTFSAEAMCVIEEAIKESKLLFYDRIGDCIEFITQVRKSFLDPEF